MYLNFKCPACDNEIQAEYPHIGEWVACPVCNFAQVVPDPLLPPGTSYGGYSIDRLFDSCLLWYGYLALGFDDSSTRRELCLMRIPTSFFMKNVANFNAFASETLHVGTSDVDGLACLVDKSLSVGKIFFVYSVPPELRSAAAFVSVFGPLRADEVLDLLIRVSETMGNAWRRFGKPHLGLSPATLMLTPKMEYKVFDYGLAFVLLPDARLVSNGFDIWDLRYTCPEGRAGHHDLSSPVSDIFSLGAIAYLLLTGKEPLNEEGLSSQTPFPELPDGLAISGQFRGVLSRMTSSHPAGRFASWNELGAALAALKPGGEAGGNAPRETRRLKKPTGTDEVSGHQMRHETVGLTHNSIKMDKKFKLHTPPKRKPHMGETVARLFSPLNKPHNGAAKSGWNPQERLVVVLIGVLVLSFMLLGAVVIFFMSRSSSQPQQASNQQGDSINIKMMAPVKSSAQEVPRVQAAKPPVEPAAEPPKAPSKGQFSFDYSKLSGHVLDLVKAADAFITANPDAFDEAVKRYEKCSAYAFDTRDMAAVDVIKGRIDATLDHKAAKVDAVMANLDAAVQPLADAGNSSAARKMYLEYNGPYKAESKERRADAAKRLARETEAVNLEGKCAEIEANARKLAVAGRFRDAVHYVEKYEGPLASETGPFRKLLAASLKKELRTASDILVPFAKRFAAKLSTLDVQGAQVELQTAMKDPTFSLVTPQLESLGMSLDLFASMDSAFLDAMRRQVGKSVQLKVKGSDADTFTVLSANDSGVSAKAGAKTCNIKFKDLDFASKMAFADSRCKLEDNPVVCALLALQSDEREALKVTLGRLPLGLEVILSKELDERDAKTAFAKLLDSTGLPYDKADFASFLANISQKGFSGTVPAKLHAGISSFTDKFSGTDFLARNRVLIDELDGACIKVGATVSDKFVIDPGYLKMRKLTMNEIIEKAPQGAVVTVKAGVYSGGVLIARDGISLEGELGVEFDGGLKVTGSNVSVSKMIFRKGKLEVNGSSDLKVDSCAFLGHGSYIKSAKGASLENCLVKGLHLLGVKEMSMNHCTLVGTGILEGKVSTSLLMISDDLSASNCVFVSDVYGVVLAAKLESKKVVMSNCVMHGGLGACTELTESGGVSKNAAKTDSALSRYMRATKMVVGEPRFVDAVNGDYTLVMDSQGSSAASDGKDCGVLVRFPTTNGAK